MTIIWQITSLVTEKNVIHGKERITLFLTRYFLPEHTVPLKTIIDRSSHNCCQWWSFLNKYCDVTTVYLWRQVNASHWHYDVIFVDNSCTCKLVQRRSSRITTVNIDLSPSDIHGLACKNYELMTNILLITHAFPGRLRAIRQQAITWANVVRDLCRHMASIGHNELMTNILLIMILGRLCAIRQQAITWTSAD